jgi:hypothetical protein
MAIGRFTTIWDAWWFAMRRFAHRWFAIWRLAYRRLAYRRLTMGWFSHWRFTVRRFTGWGFTMRRLTTRRLSVLTAMTMSLPVPVVAVRGEIRLVDTITYPLRWVMWSWSIIRWARCRSGGRVRCTTRSRT